MNQNCKKPFGMLAAGLLVLAAGCASPPDLQSPCGPSPLFSRNNSPDGTLLVFTATEQVMDNANQSPYSRRTDYAISDSSGKVIKHVGGNNIGEYEAVPRPILLQPGTYKVRALANVGLGEWVAIPVVLEAGRTTEVHLNGRWRPPAGTAETNVVLSPAGLPMGWRVAASADR